MIQNVFDSKFFSLPKFFFRPNFFFWPNIRLDNKFFWIIKFLDPNFFVPKIFFDLNFFWTKYFFGPKIFWSQNFFGYLILFYPKFFWTWNYFWTQTVIVTICNARLPFMREIYWQLSFINGSLALQIVTFMVFAIFENYNYYGFCHLWNESKLALSLAQLCQSLFVCLCEIIFRPPIGQKSLMSCFWCY